MTLRGVKEHTLCSEVEAQHEREAPEPSALEAAERQACSSSRGVLELPVTERVGQQTPAKHHNRLLHDDQPRE